VTNGVLADIRRLERGITERQWTILASRPGAAGGRLRDALLPHLPAWVDRSWDGLMFRVTQLLTGHGCFGSYLLRIGKVQSLCPHCGLEDDTADHTLQSCPTWTEDRAVLIGTLGSDLSLTGVIGAISSSRESWVAFAGFAESVMRRKEDAERIWEATRLSLDTFDLG